MKTVLYIIFIIFALIFIRFSISFIFNKLYFPNFPEVFSGYVLRDAADRGPGTGVIEDNKGDGNESDQNDDQVQGVSDERSNEKVKLLLDVSQEGCSNVCQGRVGKNDCVKYNDSFDFCELKCYGYMYNSCTSGYSGLFVMFLTQ